MACYRSGGCGPYEMYSCSECPASKPEYAQTPSTCSKKEQIRLIDAEPIEKFIVDGLNNPDKLKAFGHDAIEVLTEIVFAPTIDPESLRPQGEWVDVYGNKYANHRYACSRCREDALYKIEADALGRERYVQALSDSCPNCGAKMKGGNANER